MSETTVRGAMTTAEAADLINEILDMPGAYTRFYILDEVRCGQLVARVNHRRGRKRFIRIHPDDFAEWARSKVRDTDRGRIAPCVAAWRGEKGGHDATS